jgi:aspartate aminotransferase
MQPSSRFEGIELSLIRQLNALARPDSINLGIGEPNLEPDEEFLDMARGAATDGSWRYSPNAGFESLRRTIAAASRPTYDPFGEICVTAGTQEALYAITQAFVDDGDEVLVPDPGFLSYPTLVRLAGGSPIPYPLWRGDWSIDVDAIESIITDRTRMIIVNSPANPTGGIATGDQMVELCRIAEENDILVVSDEVYREIWYDEPPATMAGLSKNAIVIDGLSKSHGVTGLRIGWILADATYMSTIITAHQYIATCASVFSQRLAERLLENRAWNEQWLGNVRRQLLHQRDAMIGTLNDFTGIAIKPPGGAFYVFLPAGVSGSEGFARNLAIEHGVIVIPGSAFGIAGERHLRLSFACSGETIREGISRLSTGLSM